MLTLAFQANYGRRPHASTAANVNLELNSRRLEIFSATLEKVRVSHARSAARGAASLVRGGLCLLSSVRRSWKPPLPMRSPSSASTGIVAIPHAL